jgi:hypothetical protein
MWVVCGSYVGQAKSLKTLGMTVFIGFRECYVGYVGHFWTFLFSRAKLFTVIQKNAFSER